MDESIDVVSIIDAKNKEKIKAGRLKLKEQHSAIFNMRLKVPEILFPNPIYYTGINRLVHPDIKSVGPSEFSLSDIDTCQIPEALTVLYINKVYEYIKDKGLLDKCLGIREGIALMQGEDISKDGDPEEVYKKRIEWFKIIRKYLKHHRENRRIILFKSIARMKNGHMVVPVLCDEEMKLKWVYVCQNHFSKYLDVIPVFKESVKIE